MDGEKNATPRMGYTRIETERAGRHLWRPCAEHDANMPDAMVELRHERGESTGDAVNRLHRKPTHYKRKQEEKRRYHRRKQT